MNSYVGTWSPAEAVLPVVPQNADYAQYYITESGTIADSNILFQKDHWLIYIKSADRWFQSSGVAMAEIKGHLNYPDPGIYTKFQLDNNGNIVGADYLSEEDLPKHGHNAEDLKNIEKVVYQAFKKIFQSSEMSSVDVSFVDSEQAISFDVKVDDYTIIKDRDTGEVRISEDFEGGGGAPVDVHISIADVQDLSSRLTKIENDIKKAVPRSTDISSGIEVTQGSDGRYIKVRLDETSLVLNAFGEVSINPDILSEYVNGEGGECGNHQHLSNQIIDFEDAVKAIVEKSNNGISAQDIPIDGQTIIVNQYGQLSAVAMGTQKHSHVLNDIIDLDQDRLEWASLQRIHKADNTDLASGKWDLGTVQIVDFIELTNNFLKELEDRLEEIDNASGMVIPPTPRSEFSVIKNANEIEVRDASTEKLVKASKNVVYETSMIYPAEGTIEITVDGNVHTFEVEDIMVNDSSDGLKMLYKGDYYKDDKHYQGFFKGFKFSYTPNVGEGYHTITIAHRYYDESILSSVLNSYSDAFNIYEDINFELVASGETHGSSYFVSDATPKYANPVIESSYVNVLTESVFIPKEFITYDGNNLKLDNGHSESISKEVSFGKQVSFDFYIYNFDGTSNKVTYSSDIKWDNSGDIEDKYRWLIDTEDKDHNLENSQVIKYKKYIPGGTLPRAEAFLQNGDAAINAMNGFENECQFITLRFDCPRFLKSFYVDLLDKDGNPLENNEFGASKDVFIYAGISNENNGNLFMYGNDYYRKLSTLDKRLFPAFDISRSTNVRKYLTLGRNTPEQVGQLYVTFGIKKSLDIRTVIKSITESLNEYR